MCNRYTTPEQAAIERYWEIIPSRDQWRGGGVFKLKDGPFIRRARHDAAYSLELTVGQWGLIPPTSPTKRPARQDGQPLETNNCRSERMATAPSFSAAWRKGQRCVIPALDFDEPCWETNKNVWWRFRRADGDLLGLAGLWNTWTDRETGEVYESYTMLTINADQHPIMRRMHKPDPKLPPDQQDKRSVVPIELEDVHTWLAGTVEEAAQLVRPPANDVFVAQPLS